VTIAHRARPKGGGAELAVFVMGVVSAERQ
jgi:hypothetical protein